MVLNMVPQPRLLRDWLFTAEPSILKPRQSMKGLCPAFHMLGDPENLRKNLQAKQSENRQLTILEEIFPGEVDEFRDELSDHKLQKSKQNDFHFHPQLKSLFNLIMEEDLGQRGRYETSFAILMEHLI